MVEALPVLGVKLSDWRLSQKFPRDPHSWNQESVGRLSCVQTGEHFVLKSTNSIIHTTPQYLYLWDPCNRCNRHGGVVTSQNSMWYGCFLLSVMEEKTLTSLSCLHVCLLWITESLSWFQHLLELMLRVCAYVCIRVQAFFFFSPLGSETEMCTVIMSWLVDGFIHTIIRLCYSNWMHV